MYTPLDPTVEGRNRVTSMHGIDSVTGTCTEDKRKPPSGTRYMMLDPTVGDQSIIDQRLLWIPEDERAWQITPDCRAESGTWRMIRRCVVKGISHRRLGIIPLIKVARRLKRRNPAEFGKRHMIQRPTGKGMSDRRMWMSPGLRVARWLKSEGSAECGTWRLIQR